MENKGIVTIICVLISAIALISCTYIFTNGLVGYKTQSAGGGITATGSASVDFESNLIVWRGGFSAVNWTTEEAYKSLKKDADSIKNYLIKNGVKEDELVFSSIDINTKYESVYNEEGNYTGDSFAGYELTQTVTVTSSNVDLVEKISRDITELIETGVQFYSNSPEYYYTDLDELKLELIEAATENAKSRIDLMAQGSGSSIGNLISSNLGVFQITAQNSSDEDYSYGGTYNTSSRMKTATITVRLSYAVK